MSKSVEHTVPCVGAYALRRSGAAILILLGSYVSTIRTTAAKAPNVIIWLQDDLGYNDVSGFAGNDSRINNPNIESMVADSIELRNAHTFRFCSPSRSSIMAGRWPYHMG